MATIFPIGVRQHLYIESGPSWLYQRYTIRQPCVRWCLTCSQSSYCSPLKAQQVKQNPPPPPPHPHPHTPPPPTPTPPHTPTPTHNCPGSLIPQGHLANSNSLWPSDAIWWQRSGSTLAQVMACCLMTPCHYLNQWWLITKCALWYSTWEQFHKKGPCS